MKAIPFILNSKGVVEEAPAPMVFKIDTSENNYDMFLLDLSSPSLTEVNIDWGDSGSPQVEQISGSQNLIWHDYTGTGRKEYTVTVSGGTVNGVKFPKPDINHSSPVIEMVSWGDYSLVTLLAAFQDCQYLTSVPSQIPATVSTLSHAFERCQNVIGVSTWNISNVTDTSYMFNESSFNLDISDFNTLNVTDMSYMFNNNLVFNQDLSGWDVGLVTSHDDFDTGATGWVLNNSRPIWNP